MRPVKISIAGFADGRYTDGDGRVWGVTRLAEHSRGLEPFDLPLAAIDISVRPFQGGKLTVREMAEHAKRVADADISIPIMMDPDGWIMDGWHRIIRALIDGRATLPAVRFESLPPHEFVEAEE